MIESCRSRPLPTRTSVVSVVEKNKLPSATLSASRQASVALPLAGRNPRQRPSRNSGTTDNPLSNSLFPVRPSITTGTTTPAGSANVRFRQSPRRTVGTSKVTSTGNSPARSATRSYTHASPLRRKATCQPSPDTPSASAAPPPNNSTAESAVSARTVPVSRKETLPPSGDTRPMIAASGISIPRVAVPVGRMFRPRFALPPAT